MALTKVSFSMVENAHLDLTNYGVSTTNTGAQNTAAFTAALAISKALYLPAGEFKFDSLPITYATSADNGVTLVGASRDKTILRATASTTNFISLSGAYLEGCSFSNFTVDFQDAPNTASSVALRLTTTYNNLFQNIRVKNITSTQVSLLMLDGTYTTQFSNVDFGSTTGVIKAASTSGNQVTTITFVNCQFAKAVLYNYLSLTFIQPVVQGALTPKFDLTDTYGSSLGLTVIGGDIEHTGSPGTYMQFDTGTNHITSIGNQFTNISTVYSNTRLTDVMYLLDTGINLASSNGTATINGKTSNLNTAAPGIGSTTIYQVGDEVKNSSPTAGGTIGWVCTTASAQVTGSITSGTNTLTVSDGTSIPNGIYVNVYGAGTAGGILNTYVVSGGGTTSLVLFSNASTTVSGAVVTTPGVWKTYGTIAA